MYWIEVYRQLADPTSVWAPYYRRALHWDTPYLGFFGLQYVLAGHVDPHTALRIVLTLLALGWAAAARALFRSLPRGSELGTYASLLLIHSYWLYAGFFSFLIGIPVILLGLALVNRIADRSRTGASRRVELIVLGALGIVAYYCHITIGGIFCLAVAIASATQLRHARDTALRLLAAIVPAALLCAAAVLRGGHGAVGGDAHWEPLETTVARFAGLSFWRGVAAPDLGFWASLAVVIALFAGLTFDGLRGWHAGKLDEGRRRVLLVGAALAALYFLVPEGLGEGWYLKGRVQLLLWAVVLPALPWRPSPRAARLAGAAIAVTLAWQLANTAWRIRGYDRAWASVLDEAVALPEETPVTIDQKPQESEPSFDRSFLRVLAHAADDVALHRRSIVLPGSDFHPTTAFYWVQVRSDAPPPPPGTLQIRVEEVDRNPAPRTLRLVIRAPGR
jgi:hypothetical protein